MEKFNFRKNDSKEVSSNDQTENLQKYLEQIELKIGQEWLSFEKDFKSVEEKIEDEKTRYDVKRILHKASNTILSLGKKFTIAAGISAATIAGYTSINFDRQTSFNDRTKAEKELEKDGIPSDQKYSAYKPGVSELIYRSVTPFGYQDDIDENGLMPNLFKKIKELGLPNAGMPQDILANIRFGRVERIETLNNIYEQEIQELLAMDDRQEDQILNINEKYQKLAHDQAYSSKAKGPHQVMETREDAWRLYLGLNQEHGTFNISDYKPGKGEEDKYYFSIKDFWQGFQGLSLLDDEYIQQLKDNLNQKELDSLLNEEGISGKIKMLSHLDEKKMVLRDSNSNVMGNYTLGLGEDNNGSYIYYYDKWDLASKFVENPIMKGVGKPYEIYDRLYYNPETFQILNNEI